MANRPDLPPRQLAYFVPDIDAAARAHSKSFGSGPYFVARNVPLSSSMHRGVDQTFDHSSAYGQWGDVMLEFVQQHGDDPSACHDIYPVGSGRHGLHHTALFVADLDRAIARFEADGMPLAQLSETTSGARFAFADATATLGHMIELYEPSELLTGFYGMVAGAADGWDGTQIIRELG